jgi:peptidoglycan/LPS O-acetylase OafA/YrhL
LLREKAASTIGISLKNFYFRRAVRILPVNYVYIATLILLSLLTSLKYSSCQYLSALTYTKNYFCMQSVDGHLWSLAVEEQFYLIWPFVVAAGSRRTALAAATVLIAVSPISRAVEYTFFAHRAFIWLPSHTDVLMLGAVGAFALQESPHTLRKLLFWSTGIVRGIAIAAIALPEYLGGHLMLGWFTVTIGPTLQALGIVYLILSFTLDHRGFLFKILNTKFLSYVGVLSYSLYMARIVSVNVSARTDSAFAVPGKYSSDLYDGLCVLSRL